MEFRLEKNFSLGINSMSLSSVVRRGQEMFCGCSRFRFVVRVIYGTAVIIKSVFSTSVPVLQNMLHKNTSHGLASREI